MKKIILLSAFSFTILSLKAQTYTIDSVSFSALSLEGGMTQARFADINQDGHLDMISIGDHGSPNIGTNEHGITVFFGNGTGSNWSLFQNGNFGYGGCAVGDINNDGKQDVAYSMHHNYNSGDFGDQLIEAALGNGTGMNWTPWDDGLGTNGESYGMFGTDLGDINNDGLLDIASNSFGLGPGIHIYKNNNNGTWTQSYTYGYGGTTGHYIQFGDMDGDGNLDFIASNELGSTYFGNGNGSFTLKKIGLPLLPDPNQNPYGDVSLGDIDNDGDDDFAFTFDNSTTGTRAVYVFKWNKVTQQWDNASTGLPSSTTDYFTVARLADMDMDGYLDLITGSYYNSSVEIWKGNGGTSWTNAQTFTFTGAWKLTTIQDLAIADVNHSGYPDILMWASFQDNTPIFPQSVNKLKLLKDAAIPNGAIISAVLTYPKGGECWHNNAARFINWVSAIPGNHSSSVKIEYSISGSSGPWTLITAAAPNNGIYQWIVPPAINSSNCFIKVTATDNVTSATVVAMNANPFSIGCNSSTTAINDYADANTISVFPNPMVASTAIYSDAKDCSIKLFDVTGKVVKNIPNVNQFPFTMERENLSTGIYFLELRTENKVERMKLVVE